MKSHNKLLLSAFIRVHNLSVCSCFLDEFQAGLQDSGWNSLTCKQTSLIYVPLACGTVSMYLREYIRDWEAMDLMLRSCRWWRFFLLCTFFLLVLIKIRPVLCDIILKYCFATSVIDWNFSFWIYFSVGYCSLTVWTPKRGGF